MSHSLFLAAPTSPCMLPETSRHKTMSTSCAGLACSLGSSADSPGNATSVSNRAAPKNWATRFMTDLHDGKQNVWVEPLLHNQDEPVALSDCMRKEWAADLRRRATDLRGFSLIRRSQSWPPSPFAVFSQHKSAPIRANPRPIFRSPTFLCFLAIQNNQ